MSRRAVQVMVGVVMLLAWGLLGAYGVPTTRLESLVNFPNPFDSRQTPTFIVYVLKNDTPVSIRLFDTLGGSVREWNFSAGDSGGRQGENRVAWDGTDESGQKVSAGGYICQVIASEETGVVQGIRKIGVIR